MTATNPAWLPRVATLDIDTTAIPPAPDAASPHFSASGQAAFVDKVGEALPGWPAWSTNLADRLRRHGAVVVHGFPVAVDAALLALSASLGLVRADGNGWPPRLIYEIEPAADADPSYTPSLASAEFAPHTDSVLDAVPHRLVVLACVHPSAEGGDSEITTWDHLREELDEQDVAALSMPWPWANPLLPGNTPDIRWAPIADHQGESIVVRWRADVLANGLQQAGVPAHPSHQRFAEVVARQCAASRFRLSAGEVLILDNWRTVHGRTAIGSSNRHLRRLKLQ